MMNSTSHIVTLPTNQDAILHITHVQTSGHPLCQNKSMENTTFIKILVQTKNVVRRPSHA